MLGSRVRRIVRPPHQARHACRIYQTPSVPQDLELRTHTMHHARQIHCQDEIPLILIRVHYTQNAVRSANHPGDVGGAVQSAEGLDRLVDPCVDLRGVADVDGHGEDLGRRRA